MFIIPENTIYKFNLNIIAERNMSKIITSILGVVLLFCTTLVTAQDMEDEKQIFVVYSMTPENDNISQFETAWMKHNQNFHQESPVNAYYFESGPYGGSYQGVEGPLTWTGHENVEYTDAHGKDWLDNVQPLLVGPIEVGWWSHISKYQQNLSDEPNETAMITIYHIKNGEMDRFQRMLSDWYEANTEQDHDGRYNVYQRQLHGENQIAIISSLDRGLAELDDDNELQKRYLETHGDGSWQLFLDDFDLSVSKSEVSLRSRLADISTQQN